jgi:hypothetical protein
MSSGESLRTTRIFPGEKNPLPVLAALSSRQAERNHARSAAEGFLRDSPSPYSPKGRAVALEKRFGKAEPERSLFHSQIARHSRDR